MSDSDRLTTPLPASDVMAFAKAKGLLERPCARCGKVEWEYADFDSQNFITGISIIDREHHPRGTYASINFVCGNCGHIETHARSIILNWMVENDR